MSVISQAANTLALTLNGTTSVPGTLTKPASVPSAIYQVLNSDPGVIFIRFGTGTPVAVNTDLPIQPNIPTLVEAGIGNTGVAVIAPAAASGTVRITPVYMSGRL